MIQQQAATETGSGCTQIPYQQTGFYSKTIIDYLAGKEILQPFYQHPVSLAGIKAAIQQRQGFQEHREVLVSVLKKQYEGISLSPKTEQNLDLLLHSNTFTITTAHQPVIFTGPLYFAYKIVHAVKLAESLSLQLPDNNFVPVFYMGSEDADLDELGTINVDGKQYKWNTKQTGAVGRMNIDKEFIALLQQLDNQVSVLPYGTELIALFKRCYRFNKTIQQATLEVVNELFGDYGVLVVIPDSPALKHLLQPVFQKELEKQFSHQAVEKTISELSKNYKVQAGGRELNLFYLHNNSRERIEKEGDSFIINNTNLRFTREKLFSELQQYPDRFSPNVILRGVLQETILPNIIFIGGGGELAYWLELKKVFEAVNVPYPVLLLRNSFLFITQKQKENIDKLGFAEADFFKDSLTLLNELSTRLSLNQINIDKEIEEVKQLFNHLRSIAGKADTRLAEHTMALSAGTQKKLAALQKKMMRAERRKHDTEKQRIEILKQQLFPDNSLQERVENISGWYARYGKQFVADIYQNSLTLEQQFCIITL